MRQDLLADLERRVAPLLDHIKASTPPGTGFAVLLFRFDGDEATYGSNAQRPDMIKFLRECADRIEARMDKPLIDPRNQ
ncbi:MAG: hypothetical protein ACJ8C4_00565 [Gemmataceae bacterium]